MKKKTKQFHPMHVMIRGCFLFTLALVFSMPFLHAEDDDTQSDSQIRYARPVFVMPQTSQHALENIPSAENLCYQNVDCPINGEHCDLATNRCVETVCGDRYIDGNEGCDDGNTIGGDGCDEDCRIEDNQPCFDNEECATGYCSTDGKCEQSVCGDGKVSANEECDDGNRNDLDECANDCTRTTPQSVLTCAVAGGTCMNQRRCTRGFAGAEGSCYPDETSDCSTCCCIPDENSNNEICPPGTTDVSRSTLECSDDCQIIEIVSGTQNCGHCVPNPNPTNPVCTRLQQCDITITGPSSVPLRQSFVLKAETKAQSVNWKVGGSVIYGAAGKEIKFQCIAPGQGEFGAYPMGKRCSNSGQTFASHIVACKAECTSNSDCPSGQVCSDQYECENNPCTSSSQCSGTQVCINDECVENTCGDGEQHSSEQCDDGNTVNGDGCDDQCRTETCGNFIEQFGEECDDGNTSNGDGCDSQCRNEVCGNNIEQSGEDCDDGNTDDGDGCDSSCRVEICGNGIVQVNENCDDGNTTNGDGCSSTCFDETLCGNGVRDLGEECDDGNANDLDACSSSCISSICGDSVTQTGIGETCDDGNTSNGDGCDSSCQLETTCGNNAVEGSEECDDGNTVSQDGCSSSCEREACDEINNNYVTDSSACDCVADRGEDGYGDTCYECATANDITQAQAQSAYSGQFPGCTISGSCSGCYAQLQGKKTCPGGFTDLHGNILDEDLDPCCYDNIVSDGSCFGGETVSACVSGNMPEHDTGVQWVSATLACTGQVNSLPYTSGDGSTGITAAGVILPICESCVHGIPGPAECRQCPAAS